MEQPSTSTLRRPILTHLNVDTTWLLSIPYPAGVENKKARKYFHILIDPWLRGGQSDVAAFFSQQWHATPSAVQTTSELEVLIEGIEENDASPSTNTQSPQNGQKANVQTDEADSDRDGTPPRDTETYLNAIIISHEFTDHMHKETLLELPAQVPVFATTKAAAAIQSWAHFKLVMEIPRFEGRWRSSPGGGDAALPEWVGVTRVAKAGRDLLYYHSAIMITFPSSSSTAEGEANSEAEEEAEAIIYTPHGIDPSDLTLVAEARPQIKTLALMHGLQDISLPRAQLNKGAHNGLKVQRLLDARYWVSTHDEVKRGGGLVSWFLRRRGVSVREALEGEMRGEEGEGKGEGDRKMLGEIRFRDVGNGESLLLE
ncbi:major facilitator superfamily protein [Rutstroemia sp. NJR-2017a BVV2]|nr:major facilitator superfamily protein [Rutstroemia sp. NJR-2017a BVV2]